MRVDRSRHGLGLALPVFAVALLVAACCGAVRAGAAVNSWQTQARRNLVGNLQRCLLGHVHPPVETVRIEADGIDQALAPERDVSNHRQRAGQRHQVRRGRGGCHLHGLRRGTVDVGSLQERPARRRLERSQDRLRTPVWAEFTTHDKRRLLDRASRRGRPARPVAARWTGPRLRLPCAILPTSSRRRTTWRGTGGEGSSPRRWKGRTRSRGTSATPAACSTPSAGQSAYVVGHSWGGHLGGPRRRGDSRERLLGVLSVDPLGARRRRTLARVRRGDASAARPRRSRGRARGDRRAQHGRQGQHRFRARGDAPRLARVTARIPETAPPIPDCAWRSSEGAEMMPSIMAELPALEAGLPGIGGPRGLRPRLARARCRSPPRPTQPRADSRRVGGGDRGSGAFSFWFEAPGAVRTALRRLTRP